MALHISRHRKDFILLFLTRILRMISYGMLAVIFFENLFLKGINEMQASWIQTGIVSGDIIISLFLTTRADKMGRVNTLMIGSLLKLVTGIFYAESITPIILVISGIFGVISVTGGEIGPFMPIEQSALSQLAEKCSDDKEQVPKNISQIFGYYNMAGYLAQAFGAMFAGEFISFTESQCGTQSQAITNLVRIYAVIGGLMFIGYFFMDSSVQPDHTEEKKALNCAGIQPRSTKTIFVLSALFASDAFAGAFIVQSYLSFYYYQKYNTQFSQIGQYLFICNIVSGISGILSSKLVDKIGAMATMIYTHLPSNVFLIFIALTDNVKISVFLLICRFCISQMDVPARQTFVTLVVSPQERSAANGITNIARSVGLSVGLGLNGFFMSMKPDTFGFSTPFLLAGGIKILYDITIGCLFLWNQKKRKEQTNFELGTSEIVETPSQKFEEMEQK